MTYDELMAKLWSRREVRGQVVRDYSIGSPSSDGQVWVIVWWLQPAPWQRTIYVFSVPGGRLLREDSRAS
jgi:hypothetical protein